MKKKIIRFFIYAVTIFLFLWGLLSIGGISLDREMFFTLTWISCFFSVYILVIQWEIRTFK